METATPLREQIITLSDKILVFLLEQRKSDSELRFWLRQRNTPVSDEDRLGSGYWFQGSDYIFVGFSAITDQYNRTQTIGFVVTFHPETGAPRCRLEIVFPFEGDKDTIACYHIMTKRIPEVQYVNDKSWVKEYSGTSVLEALRIFLDSDKRIIDEVIAVSGVSRLLITEEKFQSMLSKTLALRSQMGYPPVSYTAAGEPTWETTPVSITDDIEGVLGVDELAGEIADLVTQLKTSEKGKMIGLFGKWGRGKSFLMKRVANRLDLTGKYVKVEFHAWKHQDTPASWAYLYEAFSQKYFETDPSSSAFPWLVRWKKSYRVNKRKYGSLPLLYFVLEVVVIATLLGFKISSTLNFDGAIGNIILSAISASGILAAIPLFKYLFDFNAAINTRAQSLFKKYYSNVSYKGLLGTQAEIQGELRNLLRAWIPEGTDEKVLLVVEDIDRCYEERIIQVIDSLRVMLEDDEISKRVVVLAAIDERVLKRAIKCKYHDLLEKDFSLKDKIEERKQESELLTSEYIDKLFIAGIKLGALTASDRSQIFGSLTDGKVQVKEGRSGVLDNVVTESGGVVPGVGINSVAAKKIDEKIVNPAAAASREKKWELSQSEYERITALLSIYQDSTPRQIRIFYYRYLLARNLLAGQAAATAPSGRDSLFALMLDLLVHYSCIEPAAKVSAHKLAIAASAQEIFSIKVLDREESYPRKYLLDIYAVLEMVVAY